MVVVLRAVSLAVFLLVLALCHGVAFRQSSQAGPFISLCSYSSASASWFQYQDCDVLQHPLAACMTTPQLYIGSCKELTVANGRVCNADVQACVLWWAFKLHKGDCRCCVQALVVGLDAHTEIAILKANFSGATGCRGACSIVLQHGADQGEILKTMLVSAAME